MFFSITFIGILGVLSLVSFFRGFVKEFLKLLGLGAGYFAAGRYYLEYQKFGAQFTENPEYAKALTYIAILLGGYLLGVIAASVLGMLLKLGTPTVSNRILGGVVGFLKGTVVCLVIYFIVQSYLPSFKDDLGDSAIALWVGEVFLFLQELGLISKNPPPSLDMKQLLDFILGLGK